MSLWRTADRFTWFLESVPGLLGLALMWATRDRVPAAPRPDWLIFVG